ncbi:hypothetical protein CUZ56_03008 [Saezia sanguinis]|uniref:Aminoglycoside phosphotransferase domain-containing protein n=1 Tax=Saezia sanguinis TaxID=1965230 RepID=A0A433S9K1_9BURK|nr:hypothetical protein [Saezia sanguinis]RUS65427.1 hypothetical protein CUZ56_03008 [Saezia sanguinis]
MNTPPVDALEQAITAHRQTRPQDRTFQLTTTQGQALWIKTPSAPRLRWLYTFTNQLMIWMGMPYFQAPPHAGGPGGIASLQIEKQMLLHLKEAGVPVPDVVASTSQWIALSTVGDKNLDEQLNADAWLERQQLWRQAVQSIADVHARGCFLSQCFARNMLLHKIPAPLPGQPPYQIYFLDLEEDPSAVMTLAQAQIRDWALFLHSTASLVTQDMAACQQFLLNYLQQESADVQQEAKRLFRQLARLRWLKHFQWLGRDGIRLYQLGLFAQGISQHLQQQDHKDNGSY